MIATLTAVAAGVKAVASLCMNILQDQMPQVSTEELPPSLGMFLAVVARKCRCLSKQTFETQFRSITTAAADWNLQRNCCALAIARGDCEFAAQPGSALPHTGKPATVTFLSWLKSLTVICQFQHQPAGSGLQINIGAGAC